MCRGSLPIAAASSISLLPSVRLPRTNQTASDMTDIRPVRVEFFGDQIESIRQIDLDTQLSGDTLSSVQMTAAQTSLNPEGTELLLNLLPADTIIIFEEPAEIAEVSEVFLNRLEDIRGMVPWKAVYRAAGRLTCLQISRFSGGDDSVHLDVTSAQQFEHKAGAIWKDQQTVLDDLAKEAQSQEVLFYCENIAEVQRVKEILHERFETVPPKISKRRWVLFGRALSFVH